MGIQRSFAQDHGVNVVLGTAYAQGELRWAEGVDPGLCELADVGRYCSGVHWHVHEARAYVAGHPGGVV